MQSDRLHRLLAVPPALRRTPDDTDHGAWAHRVRTVVERLARVDQSPLALTPQPGTVRDGLWRQHLTFHSPGRGPLAATLLAPPGDAPGPTVLVCGGKNAHLDQLTGEEAPDHPDRNVAEHLSRKGFTTLTLSYGLKGGLDTERCAARDEPTLLAHAFALTGRPLLGALVSDAVGALDAIAGHPRVDPDRTGLFGHSLGAAVALHTALLFSRPLPLCAVSHLGTYAALYARLLTGHEAAVLPGILEYADLPDLYAALGQAPLHLQYGTHDPYLDPSDAKTAAALIETASAGLDVEIHELPMGHGTHLPDAVRFFTRVLLRPAAQPARLLAQRIAFGVEKRRAVLDRIDSALATGVLSQGPQTARFEELTRTWTGTAGAAVSSGAAALEIALRVIGVSGRTVLIPVNTFFATAAAVVRSHGIVRFVDVELDGLGLDPDALRAALDRHPDTAAVIPVHIGGVVSPALTEVLGVCRERGIPVIEDAAHAFGSRLGGIPAGGFGRFGAFSFFATKAVTCGEGGLLTAAPDDLEQVRRWRDHGKSAEGSTRHDRPGGNWRLSELHAAVGVVDVARFAATLHARQTAAARYDGLLGDIRGLRTYTAPAGCTSNYYKYLAYLDDPDRRAPLKRALWERHGISLAGEVYDRLLCDQPYFAHRPEHGPDRDFPRGQWFARHHIALPLYPTLTPDEQARVADALRAELS
ncbi:DegT/DnrJ/EryC1/StrS family aminotransferase [Streptomyces sp. R08]|uniref:DegT/DnrJ/EryC1/StrS family aminotransferase n=1 Tax=Streptomyces sp. R08 TaxID=3238624 RepID=A0AB39MMI4_9ACTN